MGEEGILYPTFYMESWMPNGNFWILINYVQLEEKTGSSVGAQLRETKLEQRIAKFISLICNISMMKQQMMEIG